MMARWSHKDNEAKDKNCDDDQKSTVQTGHHPFLQIQIQIQKEMCGAKNNPQI